MKQLDVGHMDRLVHLGKALIDQKKARIIVRPSKCAEGFWFGSGALGVKPFDIPFSYLWSTTPQPSGFSIGLATVILGGLILAVAALMAAGGLPAGTATLVSFAGGIYLAVVLAFSFQTIRTGLDAGIAFGDIATDVLGIGAWVAFGGAIVITIGSRLRPR